MVGDVVDQHGGRAAGDSRNIVVFSQPITCVAPTFNVLSQIDHIAKGVEASRLIQSVPGERTLYQTARLPLQR
jgi:hypothetical protein